MTTIYHPVSIKKLMILSILTLGLYLFYAWYKNYQYIYQRDQKQRSGLWSSLFMIFTVFQLYADINKTMNRFLGTKIRHGFFWACLLFMSLLISFAAPLFMRFDLVHQAYLLICNAVIIIAFIPLQQGINAINQQQGLSGGIDAQFSVTDYLLVGVSLIFWLLTYRSINTFMHMNLNIKGLPITQKLHLEPFHEMKTRTGLIG